MTTVAARATSSQEGRKFAPTLKDARLGDVDAQYHVGLMYANGAGVKKDLKQALEWITRAAERKHAAAQYLLGKHYAGDASVGAGQQADDLLALEWLLRAANQGHARAHQRLAQLLRKAHPALALGFEVKAAGLGLAEAQLSVGLAGLQAPVSPHQTSAALGWLRRAAEQGLPAAQTALGKALAEAQGSPAQKDEARHWLQQAADRQWPPAQVYLEFFDRGSQAPPRPARKVRASAAPKRPTPSATANDPQDADARYHLGLMHELGIGVEPDLWTAQHWYTLAAAQGLPAALTALGRLSEDNDIEAAIDAYRRAAQAGDTDAQAALGRLLIREVGDLPALMEAQMWTARAAHAGHPEALLALADALRSSQPALAEDCVRRAADAGWAEAQLRQGEQCARRTDAFGATEAARWFRLAAEQGMPAAQVALGGAYRNGRGLPRSDAQARLWWERAAEQGDACARWHLSLMWAAGADDMPRDIARAIELCQRAADAGFVPAQSTLGILLTSVQRPEEAARWWQPAADHGDPEALYNLGAAHAEGRGTPPDPIAAFERFLAAAEAGLAPAQARVGLAYATGTGVAEDPIEAHKWFAIARHSGDKAAAQNLQRSQALLSPEARAEAERRMRAWLHARR